MTSLYINNEDSCTVFCQECFAKLGTSRTRKAWPPHHIIRATGEKWDEHQDHNGYYANYLCDEGVHGFTCDECHQKCCHVETNCSICQDESAVWDFFGEEPTKDELAWIDSVIGYRAYHDKPSHDLRKFFDESRGAWDALEIVKKLRNKLDEYLTENDMESDFDDEAKFDDVKRHMMTEY